MLSGEYFYKSLPRLELIFDSPNQCALFLGMLAMVLMGLTVTKWQRREKGKRYTFLLFLFGVLCLLVVLGLVLTYSRGGWVAFLSAIFLVKIFSKIKRSLAFVFTALFFVGILFFPKGSDRLHSIGDENDKSIKHRILVWQGAAAMTADHWLTGIGKDQFGKEFKLWYQPLQMKTRYAAALNNYLTLSAERGIFALFGYLVLITVPLWLVWRIVCHNDNAWIQSLLAGQFVFLISGLFTYSLTIWEVASFYWILWLFTAIYLVQKIWEKEFIITKARLLPPILFSTTVCIFVLIWGTYELDKIPTKISIHKIGNESIYEILPRHLPSQSSLLFYPESGQDLETLSLKVLRPLAAQGHTVWTYLYESANRSTLEKFEQINSNFIQSQPTPRILIGHGSGGRLGFIAGVQQEDFESIILLAPETHWPFPELSANRFIPQAKVPILILHGDQDRVVNVEDSKSFYQELQKYQKKVELRILPQTSHSISEKRFLENILTYLNKKTGNTFSPLR